MEKKMELITYDVWGNEKDGYEVNNSFSSGQFYTLTENMTDREIVQSLKKQDLIKKGLHVSSIEIDGELDYSLYFEYKGRPEFELRNVNV